MQKQEVSILSAQFSGFLKLVENYSPEKISELMREIHSMIDNIFKLHQGEINQFTGGKLLAVFNGTGSKCSHAVNAALEFKIRLKDFAENGNLNVDFGLKTGLAFGEVVVSSFGSKEFNQSTLIGEVLNFADKICEIAETDQILVDEKIHKTTEKLFDYQSLEPIPLKGGTRSLPIFELKGKKRRKLDIKSKGERKIVSEMVGRTGEVEQLERHIKNLVDGKGTVVNIVGKAGIGKSRLMDEMKVQPIMEKVLMLEGRAIATGKQLSYHPISNLIRNWAGILEDDLPSRSAEKLEQAIRRIAPKQADDIFAFTAKMMGLPLSGKFLDRVKGIEGEALEKLILKNLRDLIINATSDKPRVYVIEDMHWADGSSIKLFESLYKLSQTYPVMFINVLRPGYKETGDHLLKYLVDKFPVDHTTIHIKPLEEKESGDLIRNLLRKTTLPDEIQKMIIRKTEGNPFFIEEIIRSFIDEGIIEVKEGHFVVTEKINNVNIPETINDAILSRVDKLDEKTRELLNTASVMGRNFYYKVLEEATDTIEELDDRLSYLTEVQLITETKKKEEIEYLFKHALAQQLTYDAMMLQSRKETHLKIARSIEKVFAANIHEFYGTLAYHYSQAKNNEKTLQYMILAGDESAKSGASSEALNYYREAYDLLPDSRRKNRNDHEVRDIEFKIALGYHATGNNLEAVIGFESLLKKSFQFKFPKRESAIKIKGIIAILSIMFIIRNQRLFFRKKPFQDFELFSKLTSYWARAILHLNPKHWVYKSAYVAVVLSQYNIRNSTWALAFFTDCTSLFNLGGISLNTAQKIINFARDAGADRKQLPSISYSVVKKVQDYFSGIWEEDENFDSAIKTGINAGDSWTVTSHVYYAGMSSIELGNYSSFLSLVDKLKEIADSFDNSYTRSLRLRLLKMGYAKFRQYDKILEVVDEDINFIKATGNEAILLNVLFFKAQACIFSGKMEDAKTAIDKSEILIENHKRIPIYYTQYLITKIKFRLESIKNLKQNDHVFQSGIQELLNLSGKISKAVKKNVATMTEAYMLKAKIHSLINKNKKAKKYFKHSIDAGEKYNSLPDLSRTYFETGKFLSDLNNKYKELNGHPASHYLDKAKNMFEEMDMQWDLEEFRKFVNNG